MYMKFYIFINRLNKIGYEGGKILGKAMNKMKQLNFLDIKLWYNNIFYLFKSLILYV